MSWWWNSTSPKSTSTTAVVNSSEKSFSKESASHLSTDERSAAEPAKALLSREEQSNQELIAFLKEVQASQAEEVEVPASSDSQKLSTLSPSRIDDISPDSIYPTELSCRSAFDYAFFCQSFGGQFVNIYRYGEFRSCSNHWQDFWLCMRTRNWDEKDRKRAIQDHYKKKAIKYKQGPSSEDVWSVRTEPVRDAFQNNLEKIEAEIAEWKKANPGVIPPIEHHEI